MLVVSFLTALVSGLMVVQLLRQYLARRKPHQLAWTIALLLFFLGSGCQFLAELGDWTPGLYRIWYLSGAVLTAAYLGLGSLYLSNRSRSSHLVALLLGLGTAYAAWAVFSARVDLMQAIGPDGIASGKGMPQSVRLLTPFFNIFGTFTVVGGAFKSSWFFLWTGGDNKRAAGTGLIAIGTLVVAIGGTIARLSTPAALYMTELVGITLIFTGFSLTNAPFTPGKLSPGQLKLRRKRIAVYGVSSAALILLGSVAILPVMPWTMGIVGNVKHVYTTSVPEENRGAYLVTDQGAMQLFSWYVEPSDFPDDAPTLDLSSMQSIAIVQKQLSEPEDYRLYNLDTNQAIPWERSYKKDIQLYLSPEKLSAGNYMLIVPTDSMFGGKTVHYFRLR